MNEPKLKPATGSGHSLKLLALRLYERYGGWSKKISGAMLDQAFFSGSNFVLNILLARWIGVEGYGAFVFVYSWFVLAQNIYDAVIAEPMSIFGSVKYSDFFKRYLGFMYVGHVGISIIIGLIFLIGAGIAYVTGSPLIASALLAAAISSPLMLTRWLTRPPFYILGNPHWSTVGGIIYLVVSVSVFYALKQQELLNPFTAILTIGGSSIIASYVLSHVWLKPNFKAKNDELNRGEILKEHLDYSRWAIPDRVMNWALDNTYYITLPIIFTLAETAALRATLNLTLPIIMSLMSVTGLIMPNFVRVYEREGKESLTRRVMTIIKLISVVTVSYCLAIVIFGQFAIDFIYNGQFNDYVTPLFLVTAGLIPVLVAIKFVLDAALKVTGKIDKSFKSKIIPMIVIILGIGLLPVFGIVGANIGTLIAGAVTIFIMIRYYKEDISVEDEQESQKTSES